MGVKKRCQERLSFAARLAHCSARSCKANARWTYHFQGVQQIDYLLVSKPLKSAFVQAGVERRGIHQLSVITQGQETEFDTVTSGANAASDHGAVWAEFAV